VVVIVLFAAVFALNWQRDQAQTTDELLLPGLKAHIDDTSALTVKDADGTITLKREGERWVVPEKAGYAANLETLRQVLLAIADARKVEQKTSNPELYDRLGVGDPTAENGGILLESAGLGDQDFSLILGDPVQQEYRYVRLADEAKSWLIDQNPAVPEDASGWLAQDIVDIDSSRIKEVTITHEGGDVIHIHKDKEDATNFAVDGIPEGRELSYPSVANGIAAVLSNLTLEDVAAATEAATETADESATTTVFSTFDGLELRVVSTKEDDETWITLAASAREPAAGSGPAAAPEEPETSSAEDTGAPAAEDTAAAGEAGGSPEPETTAADDAPAPDPQAEAAEINARVSGWRYQIADYKASQLTRDWDDLLKAVDE
jgi:hypothetical protein